MTGNILDRAIFASLGLFAFAVIFSVTAVEAALFLTLLLLLVRKYREKTMPDLPPSLARHTLFAPWMIYLGVCLLTALTAYYPAKGLGQLNSDFLKYLCFTTLLLTVRKEHLSNLSAAYTLAAVAAALIGIAEVVVSANDAGMATVRANAFMNAVRYGEVMGLALMLVLSRLIIPTPDSFRREGLLYKLAVVPVFVALILSQTRGAYLGLFFGLATMLYFASPSRQKVLLYSAALAVIGAIVLSFTPTIRHRITAMVSRNTATMDTDSPDTAINIRFELWELGAQMFQAHPVLGVGPDNVKKVFKKFHPEPIGYEETWGSLHNLYIHQAAERGLIGLGALALLFMTFFLFAKTNFQAARSPYTLWALCALPAYYAMNLTEISFQHVHTAFAAMLALAFSAAAKEV